jgi:hypothetical protein
MGTAPRADDHQHWFWLRLAHPSPHLRHHSHVFRQPLLLHPQVDQRRDGAQRAEALAVEGVLWHPQRADVATFLAVDDGAAVGVGGAAQRALGRSLLRLGACRWRGWVWEEDYASG